MEPLLLPASQLLVLLAAVGAAAGLLLAAAARFRRPRRYHPVAGTLFQQLRHFDKMYDYHTEISRQHKSFRISTGPFQSDVYTNDPATVEYILCTNFRNYGKGKVNYENMKDLFGDGIFAVDGSQWRHQRKLSSHEFATRTLREHSGAIFRKNAAKFAAAMAEVAGSYQAVDMQNWFSMLGMDSLLEVAFGIKLYFLEGSSEESRRFAKALDDANLQISLRYLNPFWRLMRFLNIGVEAALRNNVKVMDDLVYKVIHSRIAAMSYQQGQSDAREDILTRFTRVREGDPKNMNLQYLRDITVSLVLAGKDSTASTMSWFTYMLCKHPSVEEKIVQEIKQVVRAPEDATFLEFATHITEEALGMLHYLHATLSETLRLYPPLAVDNKVCFSDDTLPDGFDIKKGENISYQPYCMGRMKYLWGEDAEEFRPDRWLDKNGTFCAESPYKFTAFQAGPRMCLGKEFAYRQMKITAAVLLRYFRFQLRDGEEAIGYSKGLTLLADPGMYVHVFNRP